MVEEKTIQCIDMELDFTDGEIPHGSIVRFRDKLWELKNDGTTIDFIDMRVTAKVRLVEYEAREID